MFFGEYQHTIDAKGRLIMPSRFREGLGEQFIVTKGTSGCLFVFSKEEFNNFAQRLRTLSLGDKDSQAFLRVLFASANLCEVDKQGRILLSASLREYAGLDKEAVVIGSLSRVEIWNRERWSAYSANAVDNYDDILASMSLLGV
nr:division/cell wall cluster transcriptional repressor MraZ [Maliibacterium massiliense]